MTEQQEPELTEEQKQEIENHKKRMAEDPKYKELSIASDLALEAFNKLFEVTRHALIDNYNLNKRLEKIESQLQEGEE